MIVWDLETAVVGELPENARRFLTKRAKSDDEYQEMLGEAGMNPYVSSIVVAAARLAGVEGPTLIMVAAPKPEDAPPDTTLRKWVWCENEKGVITALLSRFEKTERALTFNGIDYDVPFLCHRAARYQLRVPTWLRDAKPWEKQHLDLAAYFTCGKAMRHPRGGLEGLCHMLGVPSPKGELDGAQVGEAWNAGRHVAVGRYCGDDVDRLEDCAIAAGLVKLQEES